MHEIKALAKNRELFPTIIPRTPGVYLFFDKDQKIIYVGKAQRLRTRLLTYFRLSRSKKRSKEKKILKRATHLEWSECSTPLEAELLENQLIQKWAPPLNVSQTFYWGYPFLTLQSSQGFVSLIYTRREPNLQKSENLSPEDLFGCYRSKTLTLEFYKHLTQLLKFAGHLSGHKKRNHGVRFRNLNQNLVADLKAFLRGESRRFLETLILEMIENAQARFEAKSIEDSLKILKAFYKHEARPLYWIKRRTGHPNLYVSQNERDRLRIIASNASRAPGASRGPLKDL